MPAAWTALVLFVLAVPVVAIVAAVRFCRSPHPPAGLDPARIPGYPVSPDPETSMLYVVRGSGFGALIPFGIFLDDLAGAQVATIRGKRYVALPVKPGKHTLWIKSLENKAEAQIDVAPGQTIALAANPTFGIVAAQARLAPLDDALARYQISKLKAAG